MESKDNSCPVAALFSTLELVSGRSFDIFTPESVCISTRQLFEVVCQSGLFDPQKVDRFKNSFFEYLDSRELSGVCRSRCSQIKYWTRFYHGLKEIGSGISSILVEADQRLLDNALRGVDYLLWKPLWPEDSPVEPIGFNFSHYWDNDRRRSEFLAILDAIRGSLGVIGIKHPTIEVVNRIEKWALRGISSHSREIYETLDRISSCPISTY